MVSQTNVREHFRLLMRREDRADGFLLSLIPSPEEVSQYNPANGRAVTVEEWRVDLNGTPKSAWNVSCWRVFYFHFLNAGYGYTSEDASEIETAFFHHLRHLQYRWKETSDSPEVVNGRRVVHNRAERKRSVSIYFRIPTYVIVKRRRAHLLAAVHSSAHGCLGRS